MRIRPAHDDQGSLIGRVLLAVWPSVSLIIAVTMAASPGLFSGTGAGALLPVAVIFFWSIRRGASLPAIVVFACGLLLDLISHGPAGYWELVYLVTMLMAATVGEFANGGRFAGAAMLAACLALAFGVQSAVLSAFGAELPGFTEMATAGSMIMIAYPLIAWVLALGAERSGLGGGFRFSLRGLP